MWLKINRELISYKQLTWLLISLIVIVQINVITYNHFSGYYVLNSFQHFILRFLRGCILSLLASFFIAYSDLIVIQFLKNKVPWEKVIIKRIVVEFSLTLLIANIFSAFFTLFANALSPYTHELSNVILNNALIFSVVNIILMTILEGLVFSREKNQAQNLANTLKEELGQIKFELLKSQINPHFMFNSLNVLSGLISTNPKKAELFVDEFSHIYRYVLETVEQTVSTVEKELDFINSYLFLQQIRYGKYLTFTVNVQAHVMSCFVPPLSLQTLFENAIKHNIVNEIKPLHIEITNEVDNLVIKNNIQTKLSKTKSTGIGLKNLTKRYSLICDSQPVFYRDKDTFIAKLPLIKEF
jgi:two-component system LytT family sensor kinase